MPRKQRFKPSRKPKPDPTTVEATNTQETSTVDDAPGQEGEEMQASGTGRQPAVIDDSDVDDRRA